MDKAEIDIRFTYHKPTPEQIPLYEEIREWGRSSALFINRITPESREQSLAITALEECISSANAAIARRTQLSGTDPRTLYPDVLLTELARASQGVATTKALKLLRDLVSASKKGLPMILNQEMVATLREAMGVTRPEDDIPSEIYEPAPAIAPDNSPHWVGNQVKRSCGHYEVCYVHAADSYESQEKRDEQWRTLIGQLAAASKQLCTTCHTQIQQRSDEAWPPENDHP